MSGFETIVPVVASAAMSVAGQASRASAANEAAAAQADAQARQNQLILQRQAADQQQQRDLLEKASATQRARMAASGMDGSGGSADAILAGMSQDTADSINASAQTAQLKLRNPSSGSSMGSNLLDLTTGGNAGLSVLKSFYDSME
ncbi:hypothetical protein CCC_00507 [Paramagnetospirillum magnetotacticum MS-1]|uniref:Uncharacterized protein n=1 Tax=Paramagnetospirillum magnetotacticum MS-1 TaxID=272627 RepID=A0A0C2UX85_PARME|nr:hypothetical protein [Paramagnetospirillum magnetotacticum]KIL97446.1 hypothetical protein CCC_00507 [Paramagnetospirillum magnetotacticum MS-1]